MAKNAMSTTRQQQLEFLSAYGREAARQSNIIGKLLRFVKGEYLAGADDEEIAVGTKVIINVDSVLAGWTRWHDKKPVEQEMGAVIEGYQPPKRSDLSMNDESDWPTDNKGVRRDPWQFGNQCLMKNAKNGELYTFATTSKGGINSLGKLVSEASDYMREGHDDEYPVVELGVDSYPHSEFGRIHYPVFEIVSWNSADSFKTDDKPKTKSAPAAAQKKLPPQKSKGKSKNSSGRTLTY
jgi:hypothetical protein